MKNEVKLSSLNKADQKFLILLGYSQDHIFKSQELINTILINHIKYDNTITETDLFNIINTLEQELELTKQQKNLIRINKEWFLKHGIVYYVPNESYPREFRLEYRKYQSPMKRFFWEYIFPILIIGMFGLMAYIYNSYYERKRANELDIIYKIESERNKLK